MKYKDFLKGIISSTIQGHFTITEAVEKLSELPTGKVNEEDCECMTNGVIGIPNEKCSACGGTGKITNDELIGDLNVEN